MVRPAGLWFALAACHAAPARPPMAAVVPVTPPVAKSNVELAQLVIGEARIAMMSRNQEAMKRAMVSLQGVRYFAPAAVRGEIVQTLDELIVATGGHVSVDADVRPAW